MDMSPDNNFLIEIFEDKSAFVEDEVDLEIYEISKSEIEDLIDSIITQMNWENLIELKSNELNNVFSYLKRQLHTLKGSLRMTGFNKSGAIIHRLESIINHIENKKLSLTDYVNVIVQEVEKVKFLSSDMNTKLTENQLKSLDEFILQQNIENIKIVDWPHVFDKETDGNKIIKIEAKVNLKISTDTINNITNDVGEIRLSKTALENINIENKKVVEELKFSTIKMTKMLKELELQAESQIQSKVLSSEEKDKGFDPLEFDRFTRLQELTRMINEVLVDISDGVSFLDGENKKQSDIILKQTDITNSVLETLVKLRLVPFDVISEKLYKVVRSTSKELKKPIILKISGEKLEIDRNILDKVSPSIEHLLRNSLAHGIENQKEREDSGKSAIGTLNIDVKIDGNYLVLEISDDGSGSNLEKIKNKGVDLKLLNLEDINNNEKIIDLIFNEGFSTAQEISEISGRGVGMNIVKTDIANLGGKIFTKTESGKGTLFQIVIPLTLSNDNCLLVNISDKLVAIPTFMISEVYSLKEDIVKKGAKDKYITIGNKKVEFIYGAQLLGFLNSYEEPDLKSDNQVILVNYLDHELLLHVNKIERAQDILIKPMGPIFKNIKGILGATVLGDGRQGVLINPILIKDIFKQNYENIQSNIPSVIENSQSRKKIILVVDDSITVRRVTGKILENNEYKVIYAKDGEEALEQLQIAIPDVILSDIEMPKMDGFDLLRNIKANAIYSKIPVIMITSRTAQKHKDYSIQLGADGFLGKPYKEDELLLKIKSLLKNIELSSI
jgi:chemosensory pili system protein ChpA (sensor histidine kinase/response regulator)